MKTPVGGGASVALFVGLDSIAGLAVDTTSVYWATVSYPSSTVKKIGVGGGTPTTLWVGPDAPETLQVDAASVYFTTDTGDLMRVTPK